MRQTKFYSLLFKSTFLEGNKWYWMLTLGLNKCQRGVAENDFKWAMMTSDHKTAMMEITKKLCVQKAKILDHA